MAELEHIPSILPRLDTINNLKQWILENMTIVADTREKENRHVTGAIEQLGGRYSIETLKTADYACRLCGELRTDLLIERKNSLNELSANITRYRERFENELNRFKETGSKLILLIEDDDFNNLFEHQYQSKVSDKAFAASLFTFQARYGIEVVTIKARHTGRYIYNRFFYHIRELLK